MPTLDPTSRRSIDRLETVSPCPSLGRTPRGVGDGSNRAELISGPDRPLGNCQEVELATLRWGHWHNTRRLPIRLGDIPPTEPETAFHATHGDGQALVETSWPKPRSEPGRFRRFCLFVSRQGGVAVRYPPGMDNESVAQSVRPKARRARIGPLQLRLWEAAAVAAVSTVIAGVGSIAAAVMQGYLQRPPSSHQPEVSELTVEWRESSGGFVLDGQVDHLSAGQMIWVFTSRAGNAASSVAFPYYGPCPTNSEGHFHCNGWAGSSEEDGVPFDITAAIVTDEEALEIIQLQRPGNAGTFPSIADIPHVEAPGALATVTRVRPIEP